ncbi:hypothetical protein MASR1M74_17730 [Lentimicrobium sp.]
MRVVFISEGLSGPLRPKDTKLHKELSNLSVLLRLCATEQAQYIAWDYFSLILDNRKKLK